MTASSYYTLFSIEIEHDYYGGRCRDFDFVFPTDSRDVLKSGRLIPKVRDGRLEILYQGGVDHVPLVSLAPRRLRVGLKLTNPFFGNFTELGSRAEGTIHFYRNSGDSENLSESIVRLVGPVIFHSLPRPDRPVTLTVKNDAGAVIRSGTVTDAAESAGISYDLNGYPPGRYSIEERYPDSDDTALWYLDPEMRKGGIFGLVEIEIGESFYGEPRRFRIVFASRQEKLRYYVVANHFAEPELALLTITDVGFSEQKRERLTFATRAIGDGDIPAAFLAEQDAKVVLFESQNDVPRACQGRRNIQLARNGDLLVKHLPQVGPEKVSGDVIIHISKR